MSQENPSSLTLICAQCGERMMIHSTRRQLSPTDRCLPLNSGESLWFAGWLAFIPIPLKALEATDKQKLEDQLHCPACGKVGPTLLVAESSGTLAPALRRYLSTLLSPDFLGSITVVALLTILLFGLVWSQAIGNLLSKGGLLLIGLLVGAILFLIRIFVLPLWREIRSGHSQ